MEEMKINDANHGIIIKSHFMSRPFVKEQDFIITS